jgi:hypothetical protein
MSIIDASAYVFSFIECDNCCKGDSYNLLKIIYVSLNQAVPINIYGFNGYNQS